MTLYDIIAELRREHQTTAASKTLDLVMIELGKTRDNLRSALANLEGQTLPPGGREILQELETRAERVGLDDLDYPAVEMAGYKPPLEPVPEGTWGIALILGGSSLVVVILAVAAVVAGLKSATGH